MQPGLDDQLTDFVTAAFNRDRSLRVSTPEKADLVLTITIISYSRVASVYDEQQNISAYDLTASAQIEAHDQVRDEVYFSGTVTEKTAYNPATETEETAASRLLQRLAAEIVRRILTAW